jgi:hypothetical protein
VDEIPENIFEQGLFLNIMGKTATMQGGIVGQVLFVVEDAT